MTKTKIFLTSEEENLEMYRTYGITEWREKAIILGEDAITVKKGLEYGINNQLIDMVKLPFPDFATSYYDGIRTVNEFLADPAVGYKLYLLPYPSLNLFAETVKLYPNLKRSEYRVSDYLPKKLIPIMRDLRLSIDDMVKANRTAHTYPAEVDYKFAYISQYIDTQKAAELGLPITKLFEADEELKGFNIEGKLGLLNSLPRVIISRTLGMYGYDRTPIKKLSSILGVSTGLISYFVNTIFPNMTRTTGEMKNKLGYKSPETPNSRIEYSNPEYRDKDVHLECMYYLKNVASPNERVVLSSYPIGKVRLYIAAKYFGWTTEQICRNLVAVPNDIKALFEDIDKKKS